MNSEQIERGLLINEWQLGAQLNVALTNGTRDKFNLLLSFLSDDARDFSQFELPKATQDSLTTLELRESFELAEPQPLVNRGISMQQAKQLSVAVHQKNMSDLRLQSILNNEALLTRFSDPIFNAEIVDNLSFLAQTRLENTHQAQQTEQADATGIDYALVKQYQALDLQDKPVKVTYM